jgi:hypothetical protein
MSNNAIPTDVLIRLSIKLGIDMTPTQDLEKRLKQIIQTTTACQSVLDKMEKLVNKYENTVSGLSTVPSDETKEDTDGRKLEV